MRKVLFAVLLTALLVFSVFTTALFLTWNQEARNAEIIQVAHEAAALEAARYPKEIYGVRRIFLTTEDKVIVVMEHTASSDVLTVISLEERIQAAITEGLVPAGYDTYVIVFGHALYLKNLEELFNEKS